eukprot:gb/GEZN01012516.1/.p1 GENE.gb/GEZN01012516.1/~~gb/GEZN01012516.1/.p1  ORF type:complete len:284 (-),score=23.01 gb/GEZN01012516.1/:185-1036(-)
MATEQDKLEQEYLLLAIQLAHLAGEKIKLVYAAKEKNVVHKGGKTVDLVTETDKECEDLIISKIKKKYPNHCFIGEESHTGSYASTSYQRTNLPTWIIDPIDGTNNFVHSIPFCCVSIGLMINQKLRLGVVHIPVLNQTFHARVGKGSFLNNTQRLRVSKEVCLTKSLICTEFGYTRDQAGVSQNLAALERLLLSNTQTIRAFGSCAINMCYVAAGNADGYYERGPKPWDSAAAAVILTEAGGVVMDMSGGPFDLFGGTVLAASSMQLANAMLGVINPIISRL